MTKKDPQSFSGCCAYLTQLLLIHQAGSLAKYSPRAQQNTYRHDTPFGQSLTANAIETIERLPV